MTHALPAGPSGPPRLRLWRHAGFGLCTPALLRLLLSVQAGEAQ